MWIFKFYKCVFLRWCQIQQQSCLPTVTSDVPTLAILHCYSKWLDVLWTTELKKIATGWWWIPRWIDQEMLKVLHMHQLHSLTFFCYQHIHSMSPYLLSILTFGWKQITQLSVTYVTHTRKYLQLLSAPYQFPSLQQGKQHRDSRSEISASLVLYTATPIAHTFIYCDLLSVCTKSMSTTFWFTTNWLCGYFHLVSLTVNHSKACRATYFITTKAPTKIIQYYQTWLPCCRST